MIPVVDVFYGAYFDDILIIKYRHKVWSELEFVERSGNIANAFNVVLAILLVSMVKVLRDWGKPKINQVQRKIFYHSGDYLVLM